MAGLVAAWWLFPLGLLLWLSMVISVSRDPSLQISHRMQSREPIAQRFQAYFDRVERAQVSVFNSLSSAPARTRRVLQPIQTELEHMTAQTYSLCRRITALENYRLVSESTSNLQQDLQHMNDTIASASDPLVKQEYEESRQAIIERLAKLRIVASDLDRVEAQLLSVANEMDGVVTEVVRLQAIGADAAQQHVPVLVDRLRQQAAQLSDFGRKAVEI
jgi:hypothetical protein